MKKFVAVLMCISILFLSFSITTFANNNIGFEEFYGEVKKLADKYDNSSGLSSDGSELLYTNRLIVKTKTNDPLKNYYGATKVVEGYDGLHFLQYLNKNQAQNAYISFLFDDIEYVEYDFYVYVSEETPVENNPVFNSHLSWNSSCSQVDDAFDLIREHETMCSEVRVAVIDSGVYADHNYFRNEERNRIVDSNYKYTVSYKSIEDNSEYTINHSSMEDDFYHGTHVSGIIFDNTMENIKIIPYRVTNERGILCSDILSAFEAILIRNGIVVPINSEQNTDPTDDIDIVNMSFAGDLDLIDADGITLSNKMTLAAQNGMIIVAAAGNDTTNANFVFPACHTDVITVSATDENNIPSDFTNFGNVVDIAAPGVNIKSTTPRTFDDDNDKVICEAYSTYMTINGTSMATPLVSAAAAMIKSIDPDITPAEVKRLIKETAYVPDDWEESCGENNYGTGIVNFYNIAKAMLEPEYSATPTITINSDNNFEINAPEGVDAKIFYTLDGTIPTLENHLTYTAPLNLRAKKATSVKAACYENGKLISEPAVYDLVTYNEKSVFYKWSSTLTTDADTSNAKWHSNNPNIASVDSDGNIKGVSKGNTRITCSLPTGERIIWRVNVKYSPLQAFFVMFFFGFLWI